MLKKFKCRLALLGIAAALSVCGCSAGSPDETEAEDSLAQTAEAANYAEQAVGTSESEHPIVQDMPIWIRDEAPVEGGFVGAGSCPDGDDWLQDMPVIIFEAEPSGEGGLVPTTVIDPDEPIESGTVGTTTDPDGVD